MSKKDNTYYKVDLPNPNMSQIYDLVVGDEVVQTISLDGKIAVVKLPVGDDSTPGVLIGATKMNHSEAFAYLSANSNLFSDSPI